MKINPKELILDIQDRILKSDKDFVLDSLAGATESLEMAFPGTGHFLMEFIQNSDDAKSEVMKIEINENNVTIFNDGDFFESDDIKSICKVGRSSKTPTENIGYLGVGFKSVFLISDSPHIFSGDYRFKFDKNYWDNDEKIPWQLIPIWIEEPVVPQNDNWSTKFNLNFPEKIDQNTIQLIEDEVTNEHLNNRIVLFIKNIKNIIIYNAINDFKREIIKSDNLSKIDDYEIYSVEEYENDELKYKNQWLVFRKKVKIDEKIKKDPNLHVSRKNLIEREVLVAFRLDEDNKLQREEKGTAHTGVFSFLPLKETKSGLSFLIQSDFITTTARTDILRDSTWNQWITIEILNLIIEKCIKIFKNDDIWKMNFTNILYSTEEGHELFKTYLKKPLTQYLEENDVIFSEEETFVSLDKIIFINEEMRKLLSKEDIKFLYPDKISKHVNCLIHPSLSYSKGPKDISDFISSSENELLIKSKADYKDFEWFKKIYSIIVDKYSLSYFYKNHSRYNVKFDDFWDKMHNFYKPIILTDEYGVVKIDECYINPMKIVIPEQLKEKFKIVHPKLAEDAIFMEFRKKLNDERHHYRPPDTKVIKELTDEDIINALKLHDTIEMDENKWSNLSDDEKIETIKNMKKSWEEYSIPLTDYTYLTLKSKSNRWENPEILIFPTEYKPEHKIEILIEKGLLDFPFEFVNPIFIEGIKEENEIKKWANFFNELGVDKILNGKKDGGKKQDIVQRIGILVSKKFETEAKKRNPRVLDESEKSGYDIESKSEKEDIFIEVKGTSKSSYDIVLTVNESKTLREKKDKYFVYVVTNVLDEPLLHVSKGDKLLDISDTQIHIPAEKWLNNAKEEEYKP